MSRRAFTAIAAKDLRALRRDARLIAIVLVPLALALALRASGAGATATLDHERLKLLVVVLYLIANLALVLVPMLLAEEIERGTLPALLLAASPVDVGAAKALVGLGATAAMVALTVNLANIDPQDDVLFAAGTVLLAFALTPFGLAAGLALRSTARVSTLMGAAVVLALAPAALLTTQLPVALRLIANITPTGLAARLLADGLTGRPLYGPSWLACLGLFAWTLAGIALLRTARRLSMTSATP